ncbi:MAG: FliH/SctL family protein, partial [Pseudomonadota bacterium]|nr:FliH/SctL family protein [Pseudomonadota bacterium]
MTSSKATLESLLNQNDFAELAVQKKRAELLKKKEEQARLEKEAAEKEEQARLAALPKITEEDLQKAEKAGYEQGLEAGKSQAEAAMKAELATHLGATLEQLNDLPNLLKPQVAHIQKQSLMFIQHVIGSILKDAQQKYSNELIEFMLEKAMESAPKTGKIEGHMAPADRFYIQEHAGKALQNTQAHFVEDESIQAGECIITWDNQGVDARFENIKAEIHNILQAAHDNIEPKDIALAVDAQPEEAESEATQDVEVTAQEVAQSEAEAAP